MIFHLGFELPPPVATELDETSPRLTTAEFKILKDQIRRNTALIDTCVDRLDLFVNKERYPKGEPFLEKMRRRLNLLMEENDTFRKVLWEHYQREEILETSLTKTR